MEPPNPSDDPVLQPISQADVMEPIPPALSEPPAASRLWTIWDVLYLVLFAVPALLVASALCTGVFYGLNVLLGWDIPIEAASRQAYLVVAIQLVWWVLLLGFIYGVVSLKYGFDFLPAIGWRQLQGPSIPYLLGGVVLALSVALMAQILQMPNDPVPMQELFRDRSSVIIVAIFGVLVAPAAEEITFRGFLFPVVEASRGTTMAVLISSSLFSLVHAQQYGWRWQNLVLLLYVGIVLGTVRARTGSIVPSTLLHAGYNAALSTALLAAGDELYKV